MGRHRFNRYIVECKSAQELGVLCYNADLIDTQWNVNRSTIGTSWGLFYDLIDTQWNVNELPQEIATYEGKI